MSKTSEIIDRWSKSLCNEVSVGGLVARCATAHKWKAPYRSVVVRESLIWRMHDLGQQILLLAEHKHILGARILHRSAIETLAVLIYLNQKTDAVVSGALSFFEFDRITHQFLLGSRNGVTSESAVNILTVLAKAEKSYPGLVEMHERLSESAHPNFDGVLYGYSSSDPDKYETQFRNRWVDLFESEQEPGTAFIFTVFDHEYDQSWHASMLELELWLKNNDSELEKQRNGI